MPHFVVRDPELRQRCIGVIADRDDPLEPEEFHQSGDERCADRQLSSGWHPIREGVAGIEWMKRKGVPEQRQRIDLADRRPDHRRAGFGRELLALRRFAIAVRVAEHETAARFDAAKHDRFADEGDPGEPSTAIARRFSDHHDPRADGVELFEVEPQIAPANGVRADVALVAEYWLQARSDTSVRARSLMNRSNRPTRRLSPHVESDNVRNPGDDREVWD